MKTFSCIYGESFNFSIALQLDKYYRNILTETFDFLNDARKHGDV